MFYPAVKGPIEDADQLKLNRTLRYRTRHCLPYHDYNLEPIMQICYADLDRDAYNK
jgi:hypothetical protein